MTASNTRRPLVCLLASTETSPSVSYCQKLCMG